MATPADFATLPRNVAIVALFNTAIAAALWLGRGGGFGANLLYSQCIGMSILVCIDVTRRLAWGKAKPPRFAMTALAGAGIVAGFFIGTLIAGQFVAPPYGNDGLLGRRTLATLASTALAGTAITFYFLNRERLADLKLQAEAASHAEVEARLRLLQAQIEPHFLFNTLANLHSLIATDPARAQRMLEHLNDYLRATLAGTRRSAATLAEEFAMLRGFLEIVAIRMGPRLAFTLSLSEALAPAKVPPMLLQPLVENAVKHGLEPKVDGGSVAVSASTRDGKLVLEVADTGLGLGAGAGGTSVGLENVRARLAASYGNAASLDIATNPAGGVTATVTLPLSGESS